MIFSFLVIIQALLKLIGLVIPYDNEQLSNGRVRKYYVVPNNNIKDEATWWITANIKRTHRYVASLLLGSSVREIEGRNTCEYIYM